MKYTYIGGGEDSPQMINFMGRQEFVLGEETEVTDKQVLAKIKGHPCFKEGKVEAKELHEVKVAATEKANKQRTKDKKTNAAYKKKYG